MPAGKVEILDIKLKHGRSLFSASKFNNNLYIFGGRVKDDTSFNGGRVIYDNSFRDYLSFRSIESWIETNSTEVFNLDTLEIKEGVELPISDYAFTACSL